jgi:uncharacterized repeat protein (TIGR03803 family)
MLLVFCAATADISLAQTFTTLASFNGLNGVNDGLGPVGPLAQGLNGNLYGTARQGGLKGDGTAFEVTPSGTLSSNVVFTVL